MKYLVFLFITATLATTVNAQGQNSIGAVVNSANIKSYVTDPSKTLQIISPEKITYVDVSAPWVEGDLPTPTICRLRPNMEKFKEHGEYIVTIVSKNFLTSYKFYCNQSSNNNTGDVYVLKIDPTQSTTLSPRHQLNKTDLYYLSKKAYSNKREIHNIKSKKYGMKLWVNNIYVSGQYIFIDLAAKNTTNLPYNIDDITFRLKDKKEVNAHISQEVIIKPVFQFWDKKHNMITDEWHNIYVFRKFTFPDEKELNVIMTENQISGRKIEINIDYNQILQSATLLK